MKGPITEGKKTPWYNHPAVQMWNGYENNLCAYAVFITSEWRKRGFKDTIREKILDLVLDHDIKPDSTPPLLGN